MSWFVMWLTLTLNVYTEAGGEGELGMRMVADTVVNRMNDSRYPNDAGSVVLQYKQFSWTSRLKSRDEDGILAYNKALWLSKRMSNEQERKSYWLAGKIAYEALQEGYVTSHKYTHFFSGKRPYWAKNKKVYTHGKHKFISL